MNKVRESFSRQTFMKFIGAELKSIEEGYCEIELNYNKNLTQQHGFFHAGVVSSVADNAAGYAAFSLMNENSSVLTVEFKINLMSPAEGERLVAKASVIKKGRTLTICRSEVYSVENEEEKYCASAQLTIMELKNSSDRVKQRHDIS